eukprot:767133-Hanusia_phi.AAC.2
MSAIPRAEDEIAEVGTALVVSVGLRLYQMIDRLEETVNGLFGDMSRVVNTAERLSWEMSTSRWSSNCSRAILP